MSSLIVTLPPSLPTPATLCSTVWTEDGQTVSRHVDTPLSLLPDTPGAETVVMVPAGKLSWHRLEFPKGLLDRSIFQESSAPRLRSVLEGLLEERLLDEPAQLHFAIAPAARDGAPTWVAACDRAWLQAWLAALELAGRPVSRIVPELEPTAADAPDSTTVHAVGTTADDAQLLCRSPQGVTVLPLSHNSVMLMTHAAASDAEAPLVAEPAVAELAEQHFKGRVGLQTAPQRALVAAQSAWDLAQFDLLRTRGTRTRKQLAALSNQLLRSPQWKPARWAAVAVVLVNIVGLQVWAWKEQSALAAKRVALRSILTTTFPDVRVVVDAPLQMSRSLADLQRQSGAASSADLETMLGTFQTLALELPTPTAIEFIAGELRLKLPGEAAPALPSVATRLQTLGYAAALDGDSLVIKQERRP
ncbi:MAG: type II secretion system protein GspL [Pseudomonadota bacterium]